MKDHQIAEVVNQLRDIALQFHGAQQLRERIAHVIVPLLKEPQPDTVRLDWFQKQIKRSSVRLANMQFKSVNAWAISADGEDLRATIDAVMAQQKEPK